MTSQPGRHFKQSNEDEESVDAVGPENAEAPENAEVPEEAKTPEAEQPAQVVRVRKKRKKKRHIARKVLIVICCIILAAGLTAAGAYAYLRHAAAQGEQKMLENSKKVQESDTITYNGQTYRRNTDIVSIAIIGFDSTSDRVQKGFMGQADANMVAALNTKTGEIQIIGVPRDSMVKVDQYADGAFIGQTTEQLCLAYSYGDGGATSSEYTVDALSRVLLGQPISYYFSIDMMGIAAINDAVGGVTLTPVQSVPKAGIQEGVETTLWGNGAYDYLQYRDTTVLSSSMDRLGRQKQYLQAFAQKVLSNVKAGDIGSLVNIYNTALAYSYTNLGFDEFSYLAGIIADNGVKDVAITSLAGELVHGETYAEYYLDDEALKQTVLDVYYVPVEEQTVNSETE